MPQRWSPMYASMPVTFRWRHFRKHRQVRDDRGNHRVSSPHRLHRHLSALEDVKNTVVEVQTQRLNVSLVWIADSSPPGAMCLHVETDTRCSSKTLVRHTCKACLKVILELSRNEATVRAGTAKDVSRADTSQFGDISRALHVRPQMTLNAREVDLVLGLLTRNAHVHLSRFSSISGTDFVSLLDDAIESILDPTETVTARTQEPRSRRMTHISCNSHWSGIIIVSESIRNSDPIKSFCCVLLGQHGAPECFRTTAATVVGSTNACHGCGRGWKRDWQAV